jgi:hypothetical protein
LWYKREGRGVGAVSVQLVRSGLRMVTSSIANKAANIILVPFWPVGRVV